MRWLVMAIACQAVLCTGCAWINPTTEFGISPWTKTFYVKNNKDVNVSIKRLKLTKDGDGILSFEADDVEISDMSSPVITENVKQMAMFVEQQRAANEGIGIALEGIGSMVQTLAGATQAILRGSNIAIDTEWGGGSATLGTPATQPP